MHNVLICHNLPRHYNRKISTRCLLRIYLRKAYGMVSWEFLEEAMIGYGFQLSSSYLTGDEMCYHYKVYSQC